MSSEDFLLMIHWHDTIEKGWYYLGSTATNGSSNTSDIIVKPLKPGALGLIDNWVTVWNDGTPGMRMNFHFGMGSLKIPIILHWGDSSFTATESPPLMTKGI
jgi:hypothetical protein